MIAWTKETNLAWALLNRQWWDLEGKATNLPMPRPMYDAWVKPAEGIKDLAPKEKHKYQYDIQRHADLFMQKHTNPREI